MYGEVRTSLETAQLAFDAKNHLAEIRQWEAKRNGNFEGTGKLRCMGKLYQQFGAWESSLKQVKWTDTEGADTVQYAGPAVSSLVVIICVLYYFLLSQRGLSCKLTIKPSQVRIFSPSKDETTVFHLPPCLQLVPESCASASLVNQTELHVRVKVSDLKSVGIVDNEDEWTLRDGQVACVVCQRCGNKVTQKGLKKVVPMPSSDWEGVMEELWCCCSKDVAGLPPSLDGVPEDDGCLAGNFEIILSPSQLIWETVTLGDPSDNATCNAKKSSKVYKTVHCSRCRSCLGKAIISDKTREITAVHLWKCWTSLLHDEMVMVRRCCTSLEYLVTAYMKDICKHQVCFKFIVESEDHKAQILLWLVSPESLLLWSEHSEMQQDERGGSIRSMNIQCATIMKVLYQTCWDDKGQKMNEEWSHDMMVHSFILPLEACYQLAEILVRSTYHTPASMRNMNNLTIGYLKMS